MNKDLAYYMALHYSILLTQADDGSWFAEIPDLPGCMSFGETQQEALDMIEDAKLTWISGSLEAGDLIPEPKKATV